MPDIKAIADEADVIIAGYSLTKWNEWIRVFNLNTCRSAALVETNMDDIELAIAKDYFFNGLEYMED